MNKELYCGWEWHLSILLRITGMSREEKHWKHALSQRAKDYLTFVGIYFVHSVAEQYQPPQLFPKFNRRFIAIVATLISLLILTAR